MKKLMIAMATVAMTASMAFAQTETESCCAQKDGTKTEQCPQRSGKKFDKQRVREFEGLNLTDAQKEQIKTIKEEQKTKAQAARQAKQAQKAAKKEARQSARKEYLTKIKAVLTPEQYVQYLENAATRADKGMKRDMRKMETRPDSVKCCPAGDKFRYAGHCPAVKQKKPKQKK